MKKTTARIIILMLLLASAIGANCQDRKISQLPETTYITPDDVFPVVQSGVTKKVKFSTIRAREAFWVKIHISASDLATSDTTNSIEVYNLPAHSLVITSLIHHTESFIGGAITNYKVSLGDDLTSEERYINYSNVSQNPNPTLSFPEWSDTLWRNISPPDMSSSVPIKIFAYTEAGALNEATGGELDIYLLISILPE